MLLDSSAETWAHRLSETASDMDSMDSITGEFIERNWKDSDFVKFCFENAMHMSNAPQEAIKKVMENKEEFKN